ncbi:MAG: hypothetical protein QM726_02315 [Chitinophagaceae bacterium]
MKDSLGELTLMVPNRLDTSYKWHRTSDCLPCGRIQYRFSDSRYGQFAEGGFFWTTVLDSVYQLTLIHNPLRESPDTAKNVSIRIEDSANYYRFLEGKDQMGPVTVFKRWFLNINSRSFAVVSYQNPLSLLTTKKAIILSATTTLKSRRLEFYAECSAKDTAGFLDNMFKSLSSIKIVER